MLYPLIKETNKIHIVKDLNNCACGLVFNSEIVIKKKTLRKIKFVDLDEVTCDKCVSKLLKLD